MIEASDFDLWRAIAQAAFDRRTSHGLESLNIVQRRALAVWAASGAIRNRGFFDHSAEEMEEWATAYDALKMTEAAEAIRAAATRMSKIEWNREDPAESELDTIEERYYAADAQTESTIADFIRQHPSEALSGLI